MLPPPLIRYPAGQRSIWSERVCTYLFCILLAVAWTVFAGKDLPWDAMHYHLYAGYSVFHDRVAIDYFPAGSQTYFVPYAHAPLFLMVQAGWPSLAIGITFACMHATALWLTWELARAVSQGADGRSPALVTWGAVALALANPVLLQALGSSFTDITTGALAIGGYVALVNNFHGGQRLHRVALAGVLLGTAAALKMSNAVFALLPALPLVMGSSLSWRMRWQGILLFAGCAGGALILVGGPWAYSLWQAFGNPLFPMLDGLFNPAAPVGGAVSGTTAPASTFVKFLGAMDVMRDPRFLPSSWAEALMRPFDILAARRKIHTETLAADARYAALLCLPVLWLIAAIWRRSGSSTVFAHRASQRAWASLTASFLFAWVLWLLISGNSRYFLPMACVAAVVFVAGVHLALAGMPRAQVVVVGMLLAVQVVMLSQAAEFRWSAQPWDGAWIQTIVSKKLQTEPFLYLSMDTQSQSFLVPYLATGSAFVGMGVDIDPDSRDGRRVLARIKAHSPRLRMLAPVQAIESDGRPIAPAADTFDYALRRLALRVDVGDCEYIHFKGTSDVLERAGPKSGSRDEVHIYTCGLVSGGALSEAEVASKRRADQVLDQVEDACPDVFRSRHATSIRNGSIWRRSYPDFATWVNDDGFVRFADLFRGGGDISGLGTVKEWIESPRALKCWRRGGRLHVERSDF